MDDKPGMFRTWGEVALAAFALFIMIALIVAFIWALVGVL